MKYRFIFARKGYLKDGTALIQLRVTINRKVRYYSTGVYLKQGQWDLKKSEIKSHPKRFILTAILSDISNRVEEYHYNALKNKKAPAFEQLSAILTNKNNSSFLNFSYDIAFDEQLRDSTQMGLRAFHNLLKEFGTIKLFSDITIENVRAFDSFCFKKQMHANTIRKKHALLRRTINKAIQKGHISENPYARFQMPRGAEVSRRFLGREDLEKVKSVILGHPSWERVRDVFIFMCYTGVAHADARALRPDDYFIHSNTAFIVINRQKTGEESAIPVLQQAKEIIEKYAGGSKLLPVISNQVMNRYLEVIRQKAAVKQKLTTHVARHTFATTVTLDNGVPLEIVSRMLGHSRIATTQIYAKITRQRLADEMKKIDNKLERN